ncbi:SGNH hydrolase [Penicillium longicatenatum]|nr:SGNH hydrolase [Penicillium longicatenatum]
MSQQLSILCFGNSLTAGFYSYGLEYHPYAIKLKTHLEKEFPDLEVLTTVAGQPGDLVCHPGAFLSRIQMKCDNNHYDWVIFLGGTNDLGYGLESEKIYAGLQDSWDVVLQSGAKVLSLTIPECQARIRNLDLRRSALNTLILNHEVERYYAFDLSSKSPYHNSTEDFVKEIFDDGLHLTAKGYDLMGQLIGEHLVGILKAEIDGQAQNRDE